MRSCLHDQPIRRGYHFFHVPFFQFLRGMFVKVLFFFSCLFCYLYLVMIPAPGDHSGYLPVLCLIRFHYSDFAPPSIPFTPPTPPHGYETVVLFFLDTFGTQARSPFFSFLQRLKKPTADPGSTQALTFCFQEYRFLMPPLVPPKLSFAFPKDKKLR